MKILYVEPEATTREFILEVISRPNYQIEVCTSPAEALQFLDFESYDLIITDFRLPQNGGVNILRKLIKNKQFPKLIYFSSVRPRRSRNLKKLLKRQNIFYVPRGMTAVSIDGLSREIENYEVGIYQKMYEVYMARAQKGLSNEKTVVKASKRAPQQNSVAEQQRIKNLLETDLPENDDLFGNSVEDFGKLDLGDSHSNGEIDADWELFKKKGMTINELDYGFQENEYQEESEADWGTVDVNTIKNYDDLDEDESAWLANVREETADWSTKKEKAGEEHADWEITKQDSGEEQADWEISRDDAGEMDADWSLKNKNQKQDHFPEFVGVALSRLKALKKAPCDIYFKLGDRKMLKLINQNDEVVDDFFVQMEEKGASEMFLKKVEFSLFDDVFGKMLEQKLNSAKVSNVEKIQVMGSQLGFDYVHKQMQALGISDRTFKVAQSTIANTLEVVLKDRSLLSALKEMLLGKSYISEHSLMTVTIATEILRKLKWEGSGNVDKIAMAALFHDSLLQDEKLARLNRLSQLKNLPVNEKNLVLRHPEQASQLLEQSKFVDQDIYKIVRHHHERPQGEGFPDGLPVQALSNLTCVFILSEELVEELYTYKFDVNQARMGWESKSDFFNIGNFIKPLLMTKEIF